MKVQVLCVSLSLFLATGCATVVNGPRQNIGLGSTPTAAIVRVNNQQTLTTPATVNLERDQNHTLVFSKEGYEDNSVVLTSSTSGWVWGNVLAGGLIGGVVDFASGSARKLSQDAVHVTLTPLPVTPALPVAVVQ